MTDAILYSFRRCPYAMRARLAIVSSGIKVELREVVLKNKPAQLLAVSAKATVPVLVTEEAVIDESLDVMYWALAQSDPQNWLQISQQQQSLIAQCDLEFKPWLDKYKYADRHPEHSELFYWQQCCEFFQYLESSLSSGFLLNDRMSIIDAAIFPFIRQCAHVNLSRFEQSSYPKLQKWLTQQLESQAFKDIMPKFIPWIEHSEVRYFP